MTSQANPTVLLCVHMNHSYDWMKINECYYESCSYKELWDRIISFWMVQCFLC